ncbi:MAG: NADH-quinone oxidoreductase subunit NuoI [Thermodesulfovibrionales bacterium]|nr:NADH-quinone oxidoreductase subunit NuoI [Thermodesulfovibrionales bacterium]
MEFKKIIKTIFFTEILKGMALTFKSMLSPAVTRQYPEEKHPAMPGFRGLHALVVDPATGKEKCIACGLCAAICPSQCIYIYSTEGPDNKKFAERYEIELTRCIYCAFCVEACPVGAIVLTEHYEYTDYSREALYMTKEKLMANWNKYMAGPKGEEYFKKFWHPTADDYRAYDGQPMFRKREG